MGGETSKGSADTGEIEELGSVGDWGIPSWAPRLPRLAWLFIALTVVDIAVELVLRAGRSDGPGWPDLREAFGRAALASPILVPGAIVARAGRNRLDFRDPLLAGAVAIAVSVLLGTAGSVIREKFYLLVAADPGDVADLLVAASLRALATILGFVGPILLARSVLRHRRGPVPRWAIWAGVAAFVLAGLEVFNALAASYVSLVVLSGGLEDLGSALTADLILGLVGSFTLLCWAYLAWAVFSAAGDPLRPRFAWTAGVGSMVARMVSDILFLVLTATSYATLLGAQTTSDGSVPLVFAFFSVLSVLYGVSSILFTVAFSTGLGWPRVTEPDPPPVEFEPIPNPG